MGWRSTLKAYEISNVDTSNSYPYKELKMKKRGVFYPQVKKILSLVGKMRIIPMSPLKEEKIRQPIEERASLGKEVLPHSAVVWMPYYEVTSIIREERKSTTAVNAFLSIKNVWLEDLVYFFRPNFLEKETKKVDQPPSLPNVQVNKVLSNVPFQTEEFGTRIRELSRKLHTNVEEVRARYRKHLLHKYSSNGQEREEEKTKLSHLSAIQILLKEGLQISKLSEDMYFKKEGLFYYPYLLVNLQGDLTFIDLRKRGWFVFKKFIIDEGISKLINDYSNVKKSLEREVGSFPEISSEIHSST